MPYDGRLLAGVTVLMAVVEAGTMTRAAEALGLTQSGVGRAIQRLEVRVGVRLLDRTTRTLRLTDEGRRFWERVGPLLDGIEEAALDAAGSTRTVRGRLRVNVDPFFSRLVLSRELARFLARPTASCGSNSSCATRSATSSPTASTWRSGSGSRRSWGFSPASSLSPGS